MLTDLDYQILKTDKSSSFNKVISSIIIQANNGNTAVGPILDKIEMDIPTLQRHKAYGAVAKAYYQAIKKDPTYIALTKEMCLRDLNLMVDSVMDDPESLGLDILAILAANYEEKEKALETLEIIIDSGYAYEKYMKLREKIKNDKIRRN